VFARDPNYSPIFHMISAVMSFLCNKKEQTFNILSLSSVKLEIAIFTIFLKSNKTIVPKLDIYTQ
jgi:hypothetical protein